ncbi:MAG: methyltransferase domain-containing protein [Deltaproteobacteria bacterium]|nr:MAG: methyltransferase domain-containing protein [Deltaproteobacteria bacterium]
MIHEEVLRILSCSVCSHPELEPVAQGPAGVVCPACDQHYPVKEGILDLYLDQPVAQENRDVIRLFDEWWGEAYHFLSSHPILCYPFFRLMWRVPVFQTLSYFRKIFSAPPPGELLIDLPVGGGAAFHWFARWKTAPQIVGIDLSWEMLKRADRTRRKLGMRNVTLIRADAMRLPIRDESVESVFTLNGLHCIPDKKRTLLEISRILAPEGRCYGTSLVVQTHRWTDFVFRKMEARGFLAPGVTKERLEQMLEESGLTLWEEETAGALHCFVAQRPAPAAQEA